MERFDFGAGVMLGYEFSNGVQINAAYKIGFLNMVGFASSNVGMRNETISLGVGYRF